MQRRINSLKFRTRICARQRHIDIPLQEYRTFALTSCNCFIISGVFNTVTLIHLFPSSYPYAQNNRRDDYSQSVEATWIFWWSLQIKPKRTKKKRFRNLHIKTHSVISSWLLRGCASAHVRCIPSIHRENCEYRCFSMVDNSNQHCTTKTSYT